MKDRIDRFYEQLGSRCCSNDPVGVENFLLQCIELNDPKEDAEYMVTVCGELGSFYRGCEQYDHSLAAFERAKTVAEKAGAAETTLYASTLNNMAGTYRLMGDYGRAIDLYLQARKIYHNTCGRSSAPYIGSLNNLSLAYREDGQNAMALSCLEEAVELISLTPQLQFTLGATYSNLATLHSGGKTLEYAALCQHIRWCCEGQGRPDQGIVPLKEAIQTYTKILGEDHERTRAAMDDLAHLRLKAAGGE